MRSSAAGSTFSEYYGLNGNIGRAIMIIASLATVLLGIYTTAVPMLYTVCNKVSSDSKSWAYRIAAVVTAIVSIFGGQLSFSTMISIIYPISGYAGLVIFAGMIYTKYIKKRKYEDFNENDVLLEKKSA